MGDYPQRKGSLDVPEDKQGWNIAPLMSFELDFLKVNDTALRLRDQLMPDVVRATWD